MDTVAIFVRLTTFVSGLSRGGSSAWWNWRRSGVGGEGGYV
jgi:hypothetical protein